MSVKDIEKAIIELAPGEIAELADWFAEFQATAWDAQIEEDSRSGKLDALIAQANREFDAGRSTQL
jgi:hypothetical protein